MLGHKYDLIVFRYCLGYLHDDAEAAQQLKRYAGMLRPKDSYIIIQDQSVEEAGRGIL